MRLTLPFPVLPRVLSAPAARLLDGLRLALALLALACSPTGVRAQDAPQILQGWVMEVPSGDTVAVRDEAKRTHWVHLAGVAAPQGLQPYGGRAQAALRDLVFRQVVSVEVRAVEGRVVHGRLLRGDRDINFALITGGHAWVDAPRAGDLPPNVLKTYQDAETQARLARIGLWREKDPVPPWEKPARRR